jgi:D-alanyl-D-alanine carboxypeptidase
MQKERIMRTAALFLAVLMLLFAIPAISVSALEAPTVSRVGAAYLYNIENKKVLFEQDADKQMYPAASVKVMTALVAYEALSSRMEDTVVITKDMIVSKKLSA